MTKVPLLRRPPNPPALYVGRERERAWLADAIERAPVAVVWGFGGLGKSALVAKVLADRFADERARMAVADAGDDEGGPLAAALRVLREVTDASLDWPALTADPALAARAVVELAEDAGLWLLLENVPRTDDEGLLAALDLMSRFARDARLLLVSREDPGVRALAGQTLALGAMSDDELELLLRAHVGELSPAEARALVERAAGSPWRLLQLTLGDLSNPGGPERSLEQLAPAAQGLLRTLALIGGAVPREVVKKAARLPPDKTLDALARRGFLEQTSSGLRLHDAARPYVDRSLDDEERELRGERLLRALADADVPAAALDAVTLALARSEAELAARVLDERGDALLAAGHAARLFDALLRAGDERLHPWLCRAAVEAGGDAPAAVPAPLDETPAAQLAWAHVRFHVGDTEGALRAASVARDAPARAVEASLLLARCHLNRGAPDDALAALEHARGATGDDALQRDVLRAGALAGAGRRDEASALAGRVRARLADGAGSARTRVHLARTLYELGDLAGARDLVRPLADARDAHLTADGRRALMSRAGLDVDAGELAEARAALARLGPPTRGTLFGAGLAAIHQHARLVAGELAGVREELDDLAAGAAAHGWSVVARTARDLLAELDELEGRAPRATAAARALGAGDASGALDEAQRARALAREAGRRVDELGAHGDVCDALLVAGDRDALARESQRLADAAVETGSARFELAARFYRHVAEGHLDAGALAELARLRERAPRTARRAAACLGEDVPLDDADRAVVAAAAGERHSAGAGTLVADADGPDWVVDAGGQRVVLPEGDTVSLAKTKVLLDVLVVLCEGGGSASKQTLIERVWDVGDYHPLKHDNRLKVAVRRLRRLLEEPLGTEPVAAGEDGYRLSGRVRYVPADTG